MMHGQEKSDPAIVAMKPLNKAGQPATEEAEPRAGAEGNADQTGARRALNRESTSHGLDRVGQTARQRKKERFTALLHHIDVAALREAFRGLRRNAAAGVDGMVWQDYEAGLEARLVDLHGRVHRGAYRALPSRRVYIAKPDGKQRPLAIAALEDKIVQRAVLAVLNEIYEADFLGFSYGFRPKRGQHDALDALAVGISSRKVNFILDVDIRSFFDTVDHDWLMRFVELRVGDRRILRLIRKWLKVGVLEDAVIKPSELGTGQGAVISPLLANIYLHYGFDLWAEQWRQREARGDMIVVRYADDIVLGFEHEAEARRFREAMEKRLAEFALSLHPDKTRLIEFGRFAAERRKRRGLGKPETFTFLGFTHICGKSRSGKFLVKRKTRGDRLRTRLKTIKVMLRRKMHLPIPEQGRWLRQAVTGYFNYHAVPLNGGALEAFRTQVIDLWLKTLRRRSQKDRFRWEWIWRLADEWLPRPSTLHPWPQQRFALTHPRWEPDAGKPHVRFCAGGTQ
jgi:RNA-directed DNA polymerase